MLAKIKNYASTIKAQLFKFHYLLVIGSLGVAIATGYFTLTPSAEMSPDVTGDVEFASSEAGEAVPSKTNEITPPKVGEAPSTMAGETTQRPDGKSAKLRSKTFGVLFGKQELTIKAKSQGEIFEVKFQEGSWVKAGETIAVIDDRQENIERELASAEFDMAARDYQNTVKLSKYVSKDELRSKNNALMKKKIAFRLKDVDLANTKITAPIGGVVTKIYFDKGETVSVGDKFVEIVDLDELLLMANVPSQEIKNFKVGQEMKFSVPEFKDREFVAKLIYLSPVIDAASDTVRLKLAVKNPKGEDSQYVLKPGMIGQLISSDSI